MPSVKNLKVFTFSMMFQSLSEDYEDEPENFTFPVLTKRRSIAFSHSWSHVHITHGPAGRTTGLHTSRCTSQPWSSEVSCFQPIIGFWSGSIIVWLGVLGRWRGITT